MSTDPQNLGNGCYASWYAGPKRDDDLTRQRLQITISSGIMTFSMTEAQELYRFLSNDYGWMLRQLDRATVKPAAAADVDQAAEPADVDQAEPAVSGHCSGLYKCTGCGWQFCNLGGGNWLGPRNQCISWSDLQDHYADCSGKLQRIE